MNILSAPWPMKSRARALVRGVADRLEQSAGVSPSVAVRDGYGKGLKLGLPEALRGFWAGNYEQSVQDALVGAVRPGDVVIDVGANIGFFTLILARLVGPSGHVFALEPEPSIQARLRRNLERNRLTHVTLIGAAVSDHAGQDKLWLSTHLGGASLSNVDRPRHLGGRSIEVPTVTLDDLLAAGRLRPPQLIKIDVEGVELEVLGGATALLERHRPQLLIEIDAPTMEALEAKRRPLVRWLDDHGYAARSLPPAYENRVWMVDHLLAAPVAARSDAQAAA